MHIEVVTLFPELIRAALEVGVVGRAVTRGIVRVGCEDPRGFTSDVHRTVDDRPYGGGPSPLSEQLSACASQRFPTP